MIHRIEIPSSKIKLILMLIGVSIFIIGSYYLFQYPERFISYRFKSVEFIKAVGLFNLIFLSLAWIYLPIKLFDKKPGLILDENGIFDNSSAISVGLILWKDIDSIKLIYAVKNRKSSRILLINVHNPEKYIDRSNRFKKMLLNLNNKLYGTPLTIGLSALKYNFERLEKLINQNYELHKEK
ncbi:STM3941 family protein [Flavobacterium sp. 5]|uniref:STM3941 family protein n=1 Tax=Flavobacterium sp. 5 TaxID=2035199 RepID=UPI000C2BCD42|nr:STM3941 family protein [Flavobacterium sp. 5]PKB16550.1 hypothetical protein CLU82_1688 [Flavobacterium sp. 5]